MASELVPLRAAVKGFEIEREEHRLVKERLVLCENEGLRQAGETIAQRDAMISLLSTRLAKALDTLAVEREQQRQRRQIIFPPTASKSRNGYHHSGGMVGNGDGFQHISTSQGNNGEELERLRSELAEAQQRLESVQLEAKQKESALLSRCEVLADQLEKNTTSEKKPEPSETHPLRGTNGWDHA